MMCGYPAGHQIVGASRVGKLFRFVQACVNRETAFGCEALGAVEHRLRNVRCRYCESSSRQENGRVPAAGCDVKCAGTWQNIEHLPAPRQRLPCWPGYEISRSSRYDVRTAPGTPFGSGRESFSASSHGSSERQAPCIVLVEPLSTYRTIRSAKGCLVTSRPFSRRRSEAVGDWGSGALRGGIPRC